MFGRAMVSETSKNVEAICREKGPIKLGKSKWGPYVGWLYCVNEPVLCFVGAARGLEQAASLDVAPRATPDMRVLDGKVM